MYVQAYSRPDFFMTLTCNTFAELLFARQSSSDRHDIAARVFNQKFKSLMDFILNQRIFGDTR